MSALARVESGSPADDDAGLRTVDELAAAAGLTVRTTRYYASLGLLPPPARRGRVAWYDETHLARLEMIRALQSHGFTLQAIEGYLASLPEGVGVEDLAVQRAMLTSWTVAPPQELTRRQLDAHAGRALSDDEVALLEELGMVRRGTDSRGLIRFTPMHGFDVTVQLLDLDIPVPGMRRAGEAIGRHTAALAEELTEVLHHEVVEPWRRARQTGTGSDREDDGASDRESDRESAARLEHTIATLRQLTLDAIVRGFQRSANDLIARSLARR
ncbi:MerR family transcriptional regulator [Nocardioides sp. zg-536]|uniref:MerR family transcriptional regulator n=1 Tax=Nocardioides faecalis TaxID=2803858 RepID=A0A939BUW0_9ACTN|nr:MerR family transcriptional regulator [Nocardioides faecalis]MBM9459296.1 MerR family transcriptional regulator [Nocardioides faecalis]QVI59580.1 MerR family transcriptional regulator [Nocardioides faecalis]